MHRPPRCGKQLDDRALNSQPDKLSVGLAENEHFVGSSCRSPPGSVALFPDQQVGGTPCIDIGDYVRRLPKPKDFAISLRRAA
jgi:hypothetical protein